jgi:peptide/nickel transport system substrate-binding protein
MVFDTLFAIDDKFRPQPQMVGEFNVSPDELDYSFVLRDGLTFHDGQPVRGIDCTTSLKRWMARDTLGQTLAAQSPRCRAAPTRNSRSASRRRSRC